MFCFSQEHEKTKIKEFFTRNQTALGSDVVPRSAVSSFVSFVITRVLCLYAFCIQPGSTLSKATCGAIDFTN